MEEGSPSRGHPGRGLTNLAKLQCYWQPPWCHNDVLSLVGPKTIAGGHIHEHPLVTWEQPPALGGTLVGATSTTTPSLPSCSTLSMQ